jgi:uncharacterized membrane protein
MRAMSELVVIGFDNQSMAEEVRQALFRMQKADLVDLEDAVVAVKTKDGQVKLHPMSNVTADRAISGGFWGTLIGTLFLSPLLGAAVGAAAGAISGALTDVGINDDFIRDLAATLKPGCSALFVLVRKATPDKVLAELRGAGGKVLKTSLAHEKAEKLQAALDAVGAHS